MLGRTAHSLFWMFRYLERAENTARILQAGLRMALTRDIQLAEAEWRSILQTTGRHEAYELHNGTYTGMQAWNFILRDKGNPSSVMDMLDAVRNNARTSRNAISSELWEVINESWMLVRDMLARPVTQGQVGHVLAAIRRAGTLAHGAMAGSMLRDEGYHFARAGTFLERADSTARILDIKYYLLLPSLSYVGSSLDTGQWENILRSVSGDRAYSWLNAGQIEPRGIVQFMVLDRRFPRSLAFCHDALRDELAALARLHREEGRSNELMRQADMRLTDLTVDAIFEQGLHQFLIDFMATNADIANAIGEDYRFLV
ncbi:alpha-E domain-containing protein [Erythrobacter sp. SDW2]|uniref:alpha-E domain-containing protein n=1 Tax=Erythrobacter sp. SDW2 TaxID=2907154 RepID=UPI001F1581FD|nr:alpha-E domain-containing protein [Erythrobacter sp. SDW2]UIP07884.1 alpha-E domain-containing protein [Erythrobacter sp. SDW2]